MNANLVNVLMWSKPQISAAYLVAVNLCFWFLYYQRPISGVALIVVASYVCNLWKHRIRPEVLVDPPDNEDWVNLTTYDLERSILEFVKAMWKSWILMRSNNYFMWLALTCVFWITLAKVASHVSFFAMLFVMCNVSFVIGPMMKHLNVDIEAWIPKRSEFGEIDEDLIPDFDEPMPHLRKVEQKKPVKSEKLFEKSFGSTSESSPEANTSSTSTSTLLDPLNFERDRSRSPSAGPESLTPFGAAIPGHEESSEDEFLFDAKHFESSSSSTSNSFELIHF